MASSLALLLALLATGSASAAAEPLQFRSPVGYPAGSFPISLVLEDFNLDGDADVVSAGLNSGDLSRRFGTAGWFFGDDTRFGAGDGPSSVVSGDFDANGRPDLAVANSREDTVSILLGGSGGNFFPQQKIQVGDDPTGLALGDFDRNGDPDIAVANGGSDTVTILLGVAGGGFVREADPRVGDRPDAIAVLDANGDGDVDLVVANRASDDVSILVGLPGGSFLDGGRIGTGDGPISVAAADFNGDGDTDFATADFDGDGVSMLYGIAGASFAGRQSFHTGDMAAEVVATDLNGDADPDLAVANLGSNSLSIALGQPSTGVFDPQTTYGLGVPARSLAVGRLDDDMQPDIVVATGGANSILVLAQVPPAPPQASLTASPREMAAGGTATLDASASRDTDGTIVRYEFDTDGDGTFDLDNGSNPTAKTQPVPAGGVTYAVRVTDDDGLTDVGTSAVYAYDPPTAKLEARPSSVLVGEGLVLDATGSTPASNLVDYEFDTDGDGTFETPDGDGVISLPGFATAGERTLAVRVTGPLQLSDTATVEVTVTRVPTALSARPALAGLGTVSADLTRSGGAALPGKTVTFTTRSGAVICTATTTATGRAECRTPLSLLQTVLSLGYHASFAGDAAYAPSADAAGLL